MKWKWLEVRPPDWQAGCAVRPITTLHPRSDWFLSCYCTKTGYGLRGTSQVLDLYWKCFECESFPDIYLSLHCILDEPCKNCPGFWLFDIWSTRTWSRRAYLSVALILVLGTGKGVHMKRIGGDAQWKIWKTNLGVARALFDHCKTEMTELHCYFFECTLKDTLTA